MQIDWPTVTGIIKRLLQKKLIVGAKNPEDKRSSLIYLTDKAKHLIPEIEKISENVIKGTITNISKGDIQTTMFALQHMVENIKTK
ncbi:MarR family winged helix-turn-helix transcriptional regulator [Bacillus thuringiensis]|uniref:MarR family winged helix-turn-helix transcriptional regulator n=1 Tax=Bacillus thuringiensis TaxID=1428 RepID=UPI003D32EB4E